jgi:hypothetical protein
MFIVLRKISEYIFEYKEKAMVDVREGYNEEIHKNLNGRFYEGRNESI